jgi:hypothetical protein
MDRSFRQIRIAPYSSIVDQADEPRPLTIHAENWAAVPAPEETQEIGAAEDRPFAARDR